MYVFNAKNWKNRIVIYRIVYPQPPGTMPPPGHKCYLYTLCFTLFRLLGLGRLLGPLFAHSLLGHLVRRRIIAPLLFTLLLRLALAGNLLLAAPAPVAEVLLARAEPLELEPRRLDQPADAPVVLAVAVVVAELEQAVRLPRLHARHLEGDARGRQLGGGGLLADRVRRHVEAALALGVRRVGQDVVLVEDDANVFAVRVPGRVAVVLDVARRRGVDGVVAAHVAVLAGPPERAALLVEDVAGNDELVCQGEVSPTR